eukprot:TRINITY_DN75854_c0_g1_i1.p1 TRINITY_DN75854_c0_g1~~TRINITY_DN75854_c0_g1_i1.p1  ORF type:complete len:456 (-),score=60.57 TRINITY_DN75854_c0_g1_i1:177-1544(-)
MALSSHATDATGFAVSLPQKLCDITVSGDNAATKAISCGLVVGGALVFSWWKFRTDKKHPMATSGDCNLLLEWQKTAAWQVHLQEYFRLAEMVANPDPDVLGTVYNQFPLKSHRIDTGETFGQSTQVWTRGDPKKPKVLFVHGSMSTGLHNWGLTVFQDPRFFCNYFLIAVDSPWDIGMSAPKHVRLEDPPGTKKLETRLIEGESDIKAGAKRLLFPWLKQVTQGLGLENIDVLVGYSYGAQVIAWGALADPEKSSGLFPANKPGKLILGSPPAGFSSIPPETTKLLINVHACQKHWKMHREFMTNPFSAIVVRFLEWWYGIPSRIAEAYAYTLERDAQLQGQDKSECDRQRAIDDLVVDLSHRQVGLWPLFPKPFKDNELATLSGTRNSKNYRSVLLYPEREIWSDPPVVLARAQEVGIPVYDIPGASHTSCFQRDKDKFAQVLERALRDSLLS